MIPARPQRICEVIDCGRPFYGHGVCQRHYHKFRNSGTLILKPHKHNLRGTKEYKAWDSMKQRCFNENNPSYQRYGAAGIKVHPEWVHNFKSFLEHVGPCPSPKHSLDRYPDNQGNYVPGNVRWATASEQAGNTKSVCRVTYRGETRCLRDWARVLGLSFATLQYHYKRYGDFSRVGVRNRLRSAKWIAAQQASAAERAHQERKAS